MPTATATAADSAATRDTVVQALCRVLASKPWPEVTLADISAEAGIGLAEVHSVAAGRQALLAALADSIDHTMLAGTVPMEADETPRDRLFDVLMRRFEALAPLKPGLSAMLRQAAGAPLSTVLGTLRAGRSVALALEAAGISTHGLRGLARINAVAVALVMVTRTWLADDTADMARTMAALDKALDRAESVVGFSATPTRSAAEPADAGDNGDGPLVAGLSDGVGVPGQS